MARPANLPAPSYTQVPSNFTREEAKTWTDWNNNDQGANPDYGRFTCSGPTSWGARIDDIDEMYERMVARGVVAAEPKGPVVTTILADPRATFAWANVPKPKKRRGRK